MQQAFILLGKSMRTRVVKLCITPDQFVQNIILPEKDEMWRHLLQKNFQNRIVRDPSRLAKCQTRRNNGTKSIQASKEMSSYNFQGKFKYYITLLLSNRNPSNAMNQHTDALPFGGKFGKESEFGIEVDREFFLGSRLTGSFFF